MFFFFTVLTHAIFIQPYKVDTVILNTNNPLKEVLLQMKNLWLKEINNWSKVTEPVRGRTGI